MSKLSKFWKDEEGATAIEYGIIAGLMALALVAIFGSGEGTFVGALTQTFTNIGSIMQTGAAPAP